MTGSDRVCTAGVDVAAMAGALAAEMSEAEYFAEWTRFADFSLPKIAVVRGFALGGGCELMMMCDFAIVGEGARFGPPEIKLASSPALAARSARPV